MKEIRQIYVEQKGKNLFDHFAMVGVATALLSALIVAIEQLYKEQRNKQ